MINYHHSIYNNIYAVVLTRVNYSIQAIVQVYLLELNYNTKINNNNNNNNNNNKPNSNVTSIEFYTTVCTASRLKPLGDLNPSSAWMMKVNR